MELINNTRSIFLTKKGAFNPGKIMEFPKEEGEKLLKYKGVDLTKSLKEPEIVKLAPNIKNPEKQYSPFNKGKKLESIKK